jgi:hypothetical protein
VFHSNVVEEHSRHQLYHNVNISDLVDPFIEDARDDAKHAVCHCGWRVVGVPMDLHFAHQPASVPVLLELDANTCKIGSFY